MTYEELIISIEKSTCATSWLKKNTEIDASNTTNLEDWHNTAREIARQAYDSASRNWNTWYVLDQNYEPIYINDRFKCNEYEDQLVVGFEYTDNKPHVVSYYGSWEAKHVEKIPRDTRDKISNDLTGLLIALSDDLSLDAARKLANKYIDRIKALEEDE